MTRGFSTVVNTGRALWGDPLEVFGALGHGRSYGIKSRFLIRSLPGILESALWEQLYSLPRVPTRALVTDIGNDILYGVSIPTIISWASDCVERLQRLDAEIIITNLPLWAIQRLSNVRFKFFRSVFTPSCRLSLKEVLSCTQQLNEGVISLAEHKGLKLVRLRHEWYGMDPIHIRPSYWAQAWREILLGGDCEYPLHKQSGRDGSLSAIRLYMAMPHRRWILGFERQHTQPVIRTTNGTTIWLY